MMASAMDSVRIICDDHIFQRLHRRNNPPSGRIYKGTINAATASSSIPTKYQTIVVDNSDKKGFLSQAKRFQPDDLNDSPGPGTYVGISNMERNSASLSKRGTGMLASKAKRISGWYVNDCSPGPAKYSPHDGIGDHDDINVFTAAFHPPIAQGFVPKDTGPAPNQYNISKFKSGFANNLGAGSAFKSNSKREVMDMKESMSKPSPFQYHINDSLLRHSVRVPVSSFRSGTSRMFFPKTSCTPGPGAYRPFETVEPVAKTVFPRRHYLSISAAAMPVPAAPPLPGPGSYEITAASDMLHTREVKPTSAFVSDTERWKGDVRRDNNPSPAHYKPLTLGKQSFLYNSNSKWI